MSEGLQDPACIPALLLFTCRRFLCPAPACGFARQVEGSRASSWHLLECSGTSCGRVSAPWPHGTVPKEPVQRAVPVTALPRALLRALLHLPQGTAVAKHLGTSRLCKMSVPAPSFKRGHAHDALEAAFWCCVGWGCSSTGLPLLRALSLEPPLLLDGCSSRARMSGSLHSSPDTWLTGKWGE